MSRDEIATVELAGETADAVVWTPDGRGLGQVPFAARGSFVGRYVVLDPLGQGGMGVVYAAYDPELDRKVALKLLRPDRCGMSGAEARARLLTEARAMARLSHPNVVPVFDVETLDEQVVVAMEYIDGQTVDGWVRGAERSWREVVAVFIQAARGLAAAHDADLVHRDFKPNNVMIAHRTGTVRVLDFGLVQAQVRTTDEVGETGGRNTDDGESTDVPTTDRMTRTGMAMGTPRYMSPEQHRGRRVDAKSDQFSFCVSLWEALFGQPPFSGERASEIGKAAARGNIDPPPRRNVPGFVRDALRKGLSPTPNSRFGSMRELITALERDPARTRRRWLTASVGAVAVLGAGVGLGRIEPAPEVCTGADQAWAEVWNDDARAEMQAAFEGTASPYAQSAWSRVDARLQSYGKAWAHSHRDACEATRIRGEQSSTMLDRRMACLERSRAAARALVDVLTEANTAVVDNAVTAVDDLPPIAACETIDPTTRDPLVPDDPDDKEAADDLLASLARLRALLAAGRYDDAGPLAQSLEATARELDHGPLLAEILHEAGIAAFRLDEHDAAIAMLEEAEFTARGSEHDRLSPAVIGTLVYVLGYKMQRHEEALAWGRHGLAAARRLPNPAGARGELLMYLGNAHEGLAHFDEARDHYSQARTLLEQAYGKRHEKVARAVNNLGNVAQRTADPDEARDRYEEAAEIWARALGPEHPDAVIPLANLANIRARNGKIEEGRKMAQHVLDTWERAHGSMHSRLTIPLGTLAATSRDLHDWDAAVEHDRRALGIYEATMPPDHPLLGSPLYGLGMTHYWQGNWDDAMSFFERALAIYEKAYGPEHPRLCLTLGKLALTQIERTDRVAALPVCRTRPRDRRESVRRRQPQHRAPHVHQGNRPDGARTLGRRNPGLEADHRAPAGPHQVPPRRDRWPPLRSRASLRQARQERGRDHRARQRSRAPVRGLGPAGARCRDACLARGSLDLNTGLDCTSDIRVNPLRGRQSKHGPAPALRGSSPCCRRHAARSGRARALHWVVRRRGRFRRGRT